MPRINIKPKAQPLTAFQLQSQISSKSLLNRDLMAKISVKEKALNMNIPKVSKQRELKQNIENCSQISESKESSIDLVEEVVKNVPKSEISSNEHNYQTRSKTKLNTYSKLRNSKSTTQPKSLFTTLEANTSSQNNILKDSTNKFQTSSKSKSHSLDNLKASQEIKLRNTLDENQSIRNTFSPYIRLDKELLQEIVGKVDPNQQMEEEVETILLEMGDYFIEQTIMFSAMIGQNRKSKTLNVKDVGMALDKRFNMQFPEFGTGIPLRVGKKCSKHTK